MSFKKAFYWNQKSALNEDKVAQYNLGKFYQYGKGVQKDEVKAFEWFEKSANKDYSNAQKKLGSFYKNGIGIEKDLEKAYYWYQKASSKYQVKVIYNNYTNTKFLKNLNNNNNILF